MQSALLRRSYQTLQTGSLTIGWPALHPNAAANSGMLVTMPLTRALPGECGLVTAETRRFSGRWFSQAHCAMPMKKRWSGVKPSFDGRICPAVCFLPCDVGEKRAAQVGDVFAAGQLGVDVNVVDDDVAGVLFTHGS